MTVIKVSAVDDWTMRQNGRRVRLKINYKNFSCAFRRATREGVVQPNERPLNVRPLLFPDAREGFSARPIIEVFLPHLAFAASLFPISAGIPLARMSRHWQDSQAT